MHKFFFSRLGLCDEAAETTTVTPGGSAASPAAKPAEASAAATTIEPPKAVKPGVIDQAITLFKDKGALGVEIASLRSQLSQVTIERDGLRTQLASITGERDGLRAEFTKLETALATANASAVTVQQEVTHQLASVGVAEAKLPKGPAAGVSGSEDLAKQYDDQAEAAKDPVEKGRLSRLAFNMREQAAKRASS